MNFSRAITRQTEHILSFINPDHPQPEDIQEEILHTFQNLQRIFPRWVICTCRFMHKGFFYVSDNCEQLLGFDAKTITEIMSPDNFFKRIHPADLEHFYHCANLVTELIKKDDPQEIHKYRFVFHYRLQHADGRYLHVHDEKAILRLSNHLNLYYLLLRDIGHESPFSGVKLSVYKDGHGDKKILEFDSSREAGNLTSRESDMIPLMRQGLSIKEIGWHLGISPHTVRNIRQKLFEKFQVNNAIELLNKIDRKTAEVQADLRAANDWRFASAV